jgi:hypothetical protein
MRRVRTQQSAAGSKIAIPRKASRLKRLDLAATAIREDLPDHAIRLLARQIQSKNSTPEERTYYALALLMLGAYRETEQLLSEIDLDHYPRAKLTWVYLKFLQWDWASCVKPLEEVLASPRSRKHELMIARSHLGSALIHGFGRYEEGRKHLAQIAREADPREFRLIHVTAQQLMAQSHYLEGNMKAGLELISHAEAALQGIKGDYNHWIMKQWRYLLEGTPEKLREVRRGYESLSRWEPARMCAYYEAVARKDREMMLNLYFGTPYPGFRRKLLERTGMKVEDLPDRHDLWIGPEGVGVRADAGEHPRGAVLVDLSDVIEAGSLPDRLLRELVRDPYHPPGFARLADALYPGEIFHPGSTPDRIWQLVRRLRSELKAKKIPLDVRARDGSFRLIAEKDVRVSVEREVREHPTRTTARLGQLREVFGDRPFTAAEAQLRLGLKRWSTVALLSESVDGGELVKEGAGRSVRYRFT